MAITTGAPAAEELVAVVWREVVLIFREWTREGYAMLTAEVEMPRRS